MSEPFEAVIWRCACTAWACRSIAILQVPGGIAIVEGQARPEDYRAAFNLLRQNGWARDCMGLLCPEHVDQALRKAAS